MSSPPSPTSSSRVDVSDILMVPSPPRSTSARRLAEHPVVCMEMDCVGDMLAVPLPLPSSAPVASRRPSAPRV
eukprot:EC798800.1.p5 GENE.EC798800.1~~EC798800.1.p5  ORF type:complete len:73 (+),score=6.59 EC798800.1:316-534(+)